MSKIQDVITAMVDEGLSVSEGADKLLGSVHYHGGGRGKRMTKPPAKPMPKHRSGRGVADESTEEAEQTEGFFDHDSATHKSISRHLSKKLSRGQAGFGTAIRASMHQGAGTADSKQPYLTKVVGGSAKVSLSYLRGKKK